MQTSRKTYTSVRDEGVFTIPSNMRPLWDVIKLVMLGTVTAIVLAACGDQGGGDPLTIKGMQIESFHSDTNGITLVTTGAAFEFSFSSHDMILRQRIGLYRPLAVLRFSEPFENLIKQGPSKTGFDYVWGDPDSPEPSIVISGDSVLRLYNVQQVEVHLQFDPQHYKENPPNKGFVALDVTGGISVLPPASATLDIFPVTATGKDWSLNSKSPLHVLFIAVSPARRFDWERSLIPVVHYSSHTKRYPTDEEIREISTYAGVLELHQWVWESRYVNNHDCSNENYSNCIGNDTPLWFDGSSDPQNGMFLPEDDKEFLRTVDAAHANNMIAVPYFNGVEMSSGDAIVKEARRLKETYSIDGIYLDGLCDRSGNWPEGAYLAARGLRAVFGERGWINFHNTHDGYFAPFVQTYMDFITTSEHSAFSRWTTTTYGISNAIGGYWPEIPAFFPDSSQNITDARPMLRELVDESLLYNNRILILTGDQGQWRYWRLYFTPDELAFMRTYYLSKMKTIQSTFTSDY